MDAPNPTEKVNPNDLTVSQLAIEITRMRAAVDQLRAAEKAEKTNLTPLNHESQKLEENFRKAMEDVQRRKALVQQSLAAIDFQVNDQLHTIEEFQKLQADKLAAEGEMVRLNKLAKDIEEYFEEHEMWKEVAPFQRQGVLEALQAYRNGASGFLLADDMGLGKTLQAYFMLSIIRNEFYQETGRLPNILWLTAKNLILGTFREGMRWVPELVAMPFFGSETKAQRDMNFRILSKARTMFIANYEVVNSTPQIKQTQWDIVVVDECHKLKGGAQRKPSQIWTNTKAVIRNGTRFTLMLSGTPMVNKAEEMWAYLHIFDPELFPNFAKFEKMFGVYDYGMAKMKIDAELLLKEALMGKMIRRRKDEVGIELPELTKSFRYLVMPDDQRAVYDQMRKAFFVWLGNQDDKKPLTANAIIAQLTRLRQIAVFPGGLSELVEVGTGEFVKVDGEDTDVEKMKIIKLALETENAAKIDEAMEIVKELHDFDEQVVIFSTFNAPLFEIKRRCEKLGIPCDVVHGQQKRTDLEVNFQQGKLRVLCINSQMGQGMNLQKNPEAWPGGASNGIMLDLWWTPARNEQCISRIHRIGAKDACTFHVLHCEDSVDSFLVAKNEEKAAAFANILEKNELRPKAEWEAMLKGMI